MEHALPMQHMQSNVVMPLMMHSKLDDTHDGIQSHGVVMDALRHMHILWGPVG